MSDSSNFQLIILVIFGGFLVLGVLLFTGVLPGFKSPAGGFGGEVTLWGTIPDAQIRPIIDRINQDHREEFTLNYVAKDPNTFEQDVVDALAGGTGPDLFELSQDLIVRQENKVFVVPFDSLSERVFKDTFAEEGELYVTKEGILALPLSIDPIVMYWNRDMFSGAGITKPPLFWDEFLTLAPILTKVDQSKNVLESTIAFGEFSNVTNAKDILSLLFLQVGNSITVRGTEGLRVTLLDRNDTNQIPAESALRFYTEFSNPAGPTYSWNRALPSSRDMFTRGNLAVYFGYASELASFSIKNPHLNIDAAPVPQIRGEKVKRTFGTMTGIAIAKNSPKIQTAFSVAYLLTGASAAKDISGVSGLQPARRDLLSEKPTDGFGAVFYESAVMSRGWLDPNPKETYTIWKDTAEYTSSGRLRIAEALSAATEQMTNITR